MKRLCSAAVIAGFLIFAAPVPGTAGETEAPAAGKEELASRKQVVRELREKVAEFPQDSAEAMAAVLTSLVELHPDDEPAVLVLHNRPALTLRARMASDSPDERLKSAVKRFDRAVSGGEVPGVTVRKFKDAHLLMVGEVGVVGITRLDLDPISAETLDEASETVRKQLELILDEIREERSLKAILRAIGLSIVASLALALLLRGVLALARFLLRRLEAGQKAVEKGVGSETVREAHTVTTLSRFLVSLTVWAAGFFLFLVWLTFVLKRFPYTRPWGEEVYVFVHGTAMSVLLGIANALPNIFTVFLIIVVARIMIRIVKALFEGAEKGRTSLPGVFPETAMPTRRLLTAVIWVFAFVAIYPYLPGSGSEALRGLGVVLGLMISFGGSGVVSQAMSGLVLMYSRALRKGDYVRINETEGIVISLGMLATKIRTVKREEITIPNAVVLGTSTKNYTRLAGKEGVVLYTTVTIGYDEPWRKVHEALIAAAMATDGLRKNPKPFVRQTALSDFYVEYQINAYLEKTETRLLVLSRLHVNIQDTFNEAGILIVSPHYVSDPPHPAPDRGPGDSPPT